MMSIHDLLARMESTSSSLVPSKAPYERTANNMKDQDGSPESLGSLKNNQTKYHLVADAQLITICKCGYRPPFCACGFYKFPG